MVDRDNQAAVNFGSTPQMEAGESSSLPASPQPSPATTLSQSRSGSEDFGASPEQSTPVFVSETLKKMEQEHDWRKYFRQTQINILLILVATVFTLIVMELIAKWIFADGGIVYLKDVLTIITPIFTFLLGMGVQPRDRGE